MRAVFILTTFGALFLVFFPVLLVLVDLLF